MGMRIVFNAQGSGFGDNGGTATIYHSANVLSKLGHEVYMVSDKPSYFTWFGLDGPQYIKTQKHDYPDADILFATGVGSVKHVMEASPKKGLKFWWVRAHETWMTNEKVLLDVYRNRDLTIIVNSVCLSKFIKRHTGRDVQIFRPGVTLENFYPERQRAWDRKRVITLGALYNLKARKRFKWIPEIYEQLKMKGIDCRLKLFGTYDRPDNIEYESYLEKPNPEQLRKFYNEVDIWLAPSKSEGLHIPPQEAMLCECVVVGASAPLNGTADYLEHFRTGVVVPDWQQAVQQIQGLVEEERRMSLETLAKNGRKKILELGDRETNIGKLANWLGRKVDKRRGDIIALRRRGLDV